MSAESAVTHKCAIPCFRGIALFISAKLMMTMARSLPLISFLKINWFPHPTPPPKSNGTGTWVYGFKREKSQGSSFARNTV